MPYYKLNRDLSPTLLQGTVVNFKKNVDIPATAKFVFTTAQQFNPVVTGTLSAITPLTSASGITTSIKSASADYTALGYSVPLTTVATTNTDSTSTTAPYMQVEVTQAGAWELNSVSINAAKSTSTGTRGFTIRTSVDGYSTVLKTVTLTNTRPTLSEYALADLGLGTLYGKVGVRLYPFATNSLPIDLAGLTFNTTQKTALPAVSVPRAPILFKATATANTATLTWSAPPITGGSALTSYTLSRNDAGGSVVPNVAATATSYTFSGLTANTPYSFSIQALNGEGAGPKVDVSVTTPEAAGGTGETPTTPTNNFSIATVRANPTIPTSVTVGWTVTDPDSRIKNYKIQRNGTTIATVPSPALSYVDASRTPGTDYTYAVSGIDANSTESAAVTDVCKTGRAVAGNYTITGTKIYAPNGSEFIPLGANIGINSAIGGNMNGDESTSPHTKEALDWNWNTIRLTIYVTREVSWIGTDSSFKANTAYKAGLDRIATGGKVYTPLADMTTGTTFNAAEWKQVNTNLSSLVGRQNAINKAFQTADNYLKAGFVVILAPMDITAGNQARTDTKLDDIQDFFVQAANRYKNEPRVWLNINEPVGVSLDTFQAFHKRFYDAVRATGNNSIFVVDILSNAQDPTWVSNTGYIYQSVMGPTFIQGRSNVLFSLHNYGGRGQNTQTQAQFTSNYTNYFQTVHDAGLAMVMGEFGYRVDSKDQAGGTTDVNRNQRGSRGGMIGAKEKGVGAIVWDGTFDLFGLKNSKQSTYHCRAFWYMGAGGDLSTMGQEFWDHCHSY